MTEHQISLLSIVALLAIGSAASICDAGPSSSNAVRKHAVFANSDSTFTIDLCHGRLPEAAITDSSSEKSYISEWRNGKCFRQYSIADSWASTGGVWTRTFHDPKGDTIVVEVACDDSQSSDFYQPLSLENVSLSLLRMKLSSKSACTAPFTPTNGKQSRSLTRSLSASPEVPVLKPERQTLLSQPWGIAALVQLVLFGICTIGAVAAVVVHHRVRPVARSGRSAMQADDFMNARTHFDDGTSESSYNGTPAIRSLNFEECRSTTSSQLSVPPLSSALISNNKPNYYGSA